MQGNFYQEDFPANIVKGKICTMTVIRFNESEKKDLSIKPKLLLVTACLLYGFAVIVAYRSSVKNSKYFHIPKIRRNLIRNLFILIFYEYITMCWFVRGQIWRTQHVKWV